VTSLTQLNSSVRSDYLSNIDIETSLKRCIF